MATNTKNQIVRTRFAPSPTGDLHIGSARTALFNYLLAKHYNGKFIIRIEDTDAARNIDNCENILESELKLLHIFPDESFSNPGSFGPYRQSQKLQRYIDIAKKLVAEKKAYYCFCSELELQLAREKSLANNSSPIYSKKCRQLSEEEIQEKLKNNTPYTIRLKSDIKDFYTWDDMVRGTISVPSSSVGDFIILRTNKLATYNFAVVIDDYDMQINHLLRAEEHIANTPYQLAVYHALNWEEFIPKMGHISIVVNEKKEKLSKRNRTEYHAISTYLKKGYPTEAIINFLSLLGWSYKEEEIMSLDEIIKYFSVESISPSPTIFDLGKLNWISHKYFNNMDEAYYLNFIKNYFTIDLGVNESQKKLFALLQKDRIVCATELNELAEAHFKERTLTPEAIEKLKSQKNFLSLALKHFPEEKEAWEVTTIRNYLKQLNELTHLKGAPFFKPLRLAFSFTEEGLSILDLLLLNGREKSLHNLKITLSKI